MAGGGFLHCPAAGQEAIPALSHLEVDPALDISMRCGFSNMRNTCLGDGFRDWASDDCSGWEPGSLCDLVSLFSPTRGPQNLSFTPRRPLCG